jgi:DNA-binding HxlR family transcriptional regulator
MNSKNPSASTCPIARTLAVLGDAWTMLILRDANSGLTRFDQFRKSLGIAPTMLTKRLAARTKGCSRSACTRNDRRERSTC